MTKIIYVKGDLFASEIRVLVHGANAQKKMGSGVAKIVREKYPEAYLSYMAAPKLVVGDVIWAESGDKVIANAITQEFYGRDGAVYVSYDGLRQAFRKINTLVASFEDKRVCLPLVGSGLGGGSWLIISSIIEEECKDIQPVVYTLDGIIPQN